MPEAREARSSFPGSAPEWLQLVQSTVPVEVLGTHWGPQLGRGGCRVYLVHKQYYIVDSMIVKTAPPSLSPLSPTHTQIHFQPPPTPKQLSWMTLLCFLSEPLMVAQPSQCIWPCSERGEGAQQGSASFLGLILVEIFLLCLVLSCLFLHLLKSPAVRATFVSTAHIQKAASI